MSFVYSDMSTDLNISGSGNVDVIYDEDVIIQSLKTIFSTVTGERVRNPIGSALVRVLFEPMSDTTVRDIRYELSKSIELFEPRVEIITINVFPDYDNNSYTVDMEIRVKKLDKRVFFQRKLRSLATL